MHVTFLLIFFSITGCSSLFHNSTKTIYVTPDQFGLSWEEIHIPNSDRSYLKGWKIKGRSPDTLVVQFHGNSENRSSHFYSLAWLAEHNIDLLTFDYGGFGDSPGCHFHQCLDDIKAVLDYLKSTESLKYKKVILFGQSLGGNYLLQTLHESKTYQFEGLVLDSSFDGFWNLMRAKIGLDASSKKLVLPFKKVLIIHGEKDPVIPYTLGVNLSHKIEGSEFWSLPEGKHLDAFLGHDQIYRERFVQFLGQNYLVEDRPALTLSEYQSLKAMFPQIPCPGLTTFKSHPLHCQKTCSCDWLANYFKKLGSKKLAQMMYRQKDRDYDQRENECRENFVKMCKGLK